jgi:O-antigen/teichoic acid export membrane protein
VVAVSSDQSGSSPAKPDQGGRGSAILRGLSWNTTSQVISVLVYLGLTPFLLHRLGLAAYGTFTLVSTFWGLLSNLDGGLGPCATRYFAVFAGMKDRQATSQLLITMSVMTILVVGAVAGTGAAIAPQIAVLLHAGAHLRHEAVLLIRLLMPLLVFSAFRLLITRVIMAEHRWVYYNLASTASLLAYAGVAFVLVERGGGLIGLYWASVARETVMFLTSVIGARRYLSLTAMRLMPWSRVWELLNYASRVQVAEVASSLNFEVTALLVAFLFPVGDVGLYGIGVNFSSQVGALPMNAISPIAVTLSRAFGRDGLAGALAEFVRIQRVWVRAVGAYCLIGAASAIAAIPRWLGPKEQLAGFVAAILLIGQGVEILSEVMANLGKAVNRPGLESRYLSVGVVVGVALTVPLALSIGVLGVPIGTAVGSVVSTLYFLRIARRGIAPGLRSFFADVPFLAVGMSVLVTALLELPVYRLAPSGPAGLVACGVPALAGLLSYALVTIGPRRLHAIYRSRLPRRPEAATAPRAGVALGDVPSEAEAVLASPRS